MYTFNGGGTGGNWTDATSWTTDPTGSTSVSPGVPQNGDAVVITNSYVLKLTADVATTGLSVTVQRGGVLDLVTYKFSSTLSQLAGQGTLRIKQAYFPAVTTNNFADAGTGTVEYYNWTSTPAVLPTGTAKYNNLRLLNSTGTAYTAQLDADLLLNGNLTLVSTGSGAVTLNLGATASKNRALTVQGNISVGSGTTLGVTAVAGAHTLSAGGSFTNQGTVNLHNGTTDDSQVALLLFTGANNATFACNGPTNLGRLQIDKGTDSQNMLDVTASVASGGASASNLQLSYLGDGALLILTNGIIRLGGNIYLPRVYNGAPAGVGFDIGTSSTSPTLWIAGATVLNNNATGVVVYGTYRISAGRFESVTPDAMVIREDGQVLVEGGTTLLDKFRPSSTSSNHRGSFIMTGGEFEVSGKYTGTTTTTTFARFAIPYLTQAFRMSGGTLRVANPANCTGLFHVGINPNNAIVSGGSIELQLPATNTNASILTTAPLWNLTLKKPTSGGTNTAVLANINSQYTSGATNNAQPLTVLNNLTIDGTNPTTFDAANLNVTIQGSFVVAQGSTYLPGTNTTIFSGGQNQTLTNNGAIGTANNAFNNLTMDKPAGTLTLGGSNNSYTVSGTLSLLNGVLSDGGKTLYAVGSVVNSATHTSDGGSGSITLSGSSNQTVSGNGSGIFGNLRINSTVATGAVAATFTANMAVASTLTMMSNTVLNIGANRLSLTNVLSSGAGSALVLGPDVAAFSTSCFIQTAGNQSDLGLQKTYGKGDTFVFPVGTITVSGNTTTVRYAPATIELRLASSAPLDKFGQVSVSPVAARSPFVTASNNSLAYYWKVRSVGFGAIPSSSVYETFRMTNADAAVTGTSLSNYVPARYLPTAWTKYTGTVDVGNASSNINFSALNDFPGEFTAGDPSAFGTVTAYYTRVASGNWADASTWSTAGFNGAAASKAPASNNPVFIGSASAGLYHTVTVAANGASSGSLVIDRGSTMDVGVTTGHNFGALPDAKVGGSGRLRVSTSAASVTFPGGDFGSFIQQNGGTVEYYTTGTQNFTLPTASGTLTLNQYRNLWVNAGSGRTITMPTQDLRVYAQLKTGVANGSTTFPGTVLLSTGSTGNLRADSLLAVQAGTLSYANTTARTLTADTDVRVDVGATLNVTNTNAAVANALSVGRSLTNNGVVDFFNSTTTNNTTTIRKVDLTFTSAQNGSFTGTNANAANGSYTGAYTDLATMTVNKDQGQASVLTLDVAGTLSTPTNSWLTLTNGTLRYAKTTGTLTIHDAASPYLIPATAALTIDAVGATATVATGGGATTDNTTPTNNTSSPSDLRLGGQLQVLQGTLNVGTTTGLGNDLEYASAGAPTIRIGAAGTLYVNGQIRRTTANTDGALRYDQVGGTVNIDGARATVYQSNERGLFEVQGKGSIFRMSGGTLNLRGSNGRPAIIADLYVRPDSTVVTAGLVQLGNTAASALTVSVESLVPLWDMKVINGPSNGSNTGMLTGVNPLRLKGSLTIDGDYAAFNANGLGLSIDQNLLNNNSSTSTTLNTGGFRPGTAAQTTTFTGLGPALQKVTSTLTDANNAPVYNLTVFGSLTLNNAQAGGTLQLDRDARVAGTLTLTKGTLADNGRTLTVLGNVVNSATHTSASGGSLVLGGSTNQAVDGNDKGRFGNLTLNNAAGATTLANHEVTGVLNLTSGVLTIGSNLLWLSNPAAGAVTNYSSSNFIRTNGIVADLGLRKSFPAAAQDFTFPVGAAAKYTPVRLNITANSAVGTLTVKPVDLAHPSTTDPRATEITFYWKVGSTGFSQPTVDHYFTYATDDVNGTEANYKIGRFVGGAWIPQGGTTPTALSSTHTISKTGLTYFDGDYTAGETGEFGAVSTYYSRTATAGQAGGANWDSPGAWTFKKDGSDDVATAMPTAAPTTANPVTILAGHLINSNGAGRGAASLNLLGTLDLGSYGANNFNAVTGTGTVRIGSALFPAGNYAAFVDTGGGTVEYTSANQLPARDTYNNLAFSGGNAKLLSNLDLTINGALTVAANTTVSNPTNQAINLTSSTLGVSVGGTFNLGDGPLSTTAGLATVSGGTLNLGAGLLNIGTTLANGGTLNNGSADVQVGTAFSNTGTYNANANTGNLLVSTTFSNSGTYNAGSGRLLVSGNLTNEGTGTFTNATGDVTTQGNFTNYGTYGNTDGIAHTLRVSGNFLNQTVTTQRLAGTSAGSFAAAGTSTLVLYGDFTNQASFDAGNSLVQFIHDSPHSIKGATTFFDVRKQGAATTGLASNISIGDVLTMQSGLLATNGNTLTMLNPAVQPVVGASTASYVAGRLAMNLPTAASTRVFPVGLGGRYRPVTLRPASTSANSGTPQAVVEIINSAPQGSLDATLSNMSANRYYRVQMLNGTATNPTVQISFNTDVVDEEVHVPGNLRVARSNGNSGPWTTANGAGVFSPDDPRGYTTSAATTVDGNSFFALASTNKVDNPLTGSAPLPVQLVRFAATRQGSQVRLDWATASELRSSHFVVQRSADGRAFTDGQQVAAQGTSATRHDYLAFDAAPLPGLSYYRLKQVDTDGTFAYSPVAAVCFDEAGPSAAPALVAYPNPSAAGQGFRLQASNLAATSGTVRLFDTVGRQVLVQTVAAGTAEIAIQPTQPLPTGVYYATWQATDGPRLSVKVVVE